MACADCFKGYVRTDVKPAGTITTVYDLPTYVAQPPSGTTAKGVIVFVPDAFGWEFVNNRILADAYAAAGFRVYLPEFMNGVAAPVYTIECLDRFTSTSSIWDWIYKPYDFFWIARGIIPFLWQNLPATSHPRVVKFFEKLRTTPLPEDKGLKVGGAGFCWGGKHLAMLAHAEEAHLIDSVFTAHPSMWKVPDDVEKIKRPISIAVGDHDNQLSLQQINVVEKILKKLNSEVDGMQSELVVYTGAAHGFSVRIDAKNPKQIEQSQQAERQAISWFEETLT